MADDVLQFYAFSADNPAGSGPGDVVVDATIYAELNSMKNWRRMFSSLWAESAFRYDGFTYQSYEHAYQAAKFVVNGYHDIAFAFAVESGSALSKSTGKTVQRAGRKRQLNEDEVRRWDAQRPAIKDAIYRAKYTITSEPGKALMATGQARLINAGPRIRTIRCVRLEALRKVLQEECVVARSVM